MSLKIINLTSATPNLTVDNNIISVDNTLITIDMTMGDLTEHILKISYRYYTPEVNLYLWDEIREIETIIPITVESEPGLMVLTFIHTFVDGDSYEVRVMDAVEGKENNLIWRGKILATTQTDLEDYKLHKVGTNNIIKI
jgi:hypothetical protein